MISNDVPLQNNYRGPNVFALDPEALHEIHVDDSGDAVKFATGSTRSRRSPRCDEGS